MKKCVFLVPVTGEFSHRGDAMTAHDWGVLSRTADVLDLDAHIVFAVQDPTCAGNTKKVTMKLMRAERERVVDEITAVAPDLIVCLGPVAVQCAVNKGNQPLTNYMRKQFEFDGIPGVPTYATQSLDMVRAKPGAEKWLVLDIKAALRGYVETKWGEYIVLQPGTPEWNECPDELRKFL